MASKTTTTASKTTTASMQAIKLMASGQNAQSGINLVSIAASALSKQASGQASGQAGKMQQLYCSTCKKAFWGLPGTTHGSTCLTRIGKAQYWQPAPTNFNITTSPLFVSLPAFCNAGQAAAQKAQPNLTASAARNKAYNLSGHNGCYKLPYNAIFTVFIVQQGQAGKAKKYMLAQSVQAAQAFFNGQPLPAINFAGLPQQIVNGINTIAALLQG